MFATDFTPGVPFGEDAVITDTSGVGLDDDVLAGVVGAT